MTAALKYESRLYEAASVKIIDMVSNRNHSDSNFLRGTLYV